MKNCLNCKEPLDKSADSDECIYCRMPIVENLKKTPGGNSIRKRQIQQ